MSPSMSKAYVNGIDKLMGAGGSIDNFQKARAPAPVEAEDPHHDRAADWFSFVMAGERVPATC